MSSDAVPSHGVEGVSPTSSAEPAALGQAPGASAVVPVLGANSLIQGTAVAFGHPLARLRARRLEAVVLNRTRDALVHYRRDQIRPDHVWVRGAVISTLAVGPGAIADVRAGRGTAADDGPVELHVLVPEAVEGELVIGHHVRRTTPPHVGHWSRIGALEGSACALVWHLRWAELHALVTRGAAVEHRVYDPAGNIWATRGVLPRRWNQGVNGVGLAYTRDGLLATVAGPEEVSVCAWNGASWRVAATLPASAAAAAAWVPGGAGAGAQVAIGDGEGLRVWAPGPEGSTDVGLSVGTGRGRTRAFGLARAHGERDRYGSEHGWAPHERLTSPGPVADPARSVSGVALAPSSLAAPGLRGLGDGRPSLAGRGWLQALVAEGESVFHYHRQEAAGRVRWVRAGCLRFDPGDGEPPAEVEAAGSSIKLAQVTGEVDSQPGAGETLSRSWSRSGVKGTDLGVHVEHEGRSFLLFGDTHWRGPLRITRDVIGEVLPGRATDPAASAEVGGVGVLEAGEGTGIQACGGAGRRELPRVELHGAPTSIVGGLVTSREYDVPLDAFSHDGDLYTFFSSNHFLRHQTMGRSVLTRAVDPTLPIRGRERRRPIEFTLLGTFSDLFFVNVSAVRRGSTVYLFGSGSYRNDDLRLAALDLDAPGVRDALAGRRRWSRPLPGLHYWVGPGRWSDDEAEARPVVTGAFGEISVRWVEALGRYVFLSMDAPEDPLGFCVTLRTAPQPWGPWSQRVPLFDWIANGQSPHDEASRFIRAHLDDPVGDALFKPQRDMTGAAYAPHLFDAWRDGDDVVLRYTLSTWNPYQVVLMRHRLPGAAALGLSGRRDRAAGSQ